MSEHPRLTALAPQVRQTLSQTAQYLHHAGAIRKTPSSCRTEKVPRGRHLPRGLSPISSFREREQMSHGNDNPWKTEEVDYLIAQWKAGARGTEIGKHLGRTRNSVIGKADRMGLNRLDAAPRPPRARYPAKPKQRSFSTRSLVGMYRGMEWKPPVHYAVGRVPLHTIQPGQCRYIAVGTAGLDTLMCGEPVFKAPYCGYHDQLCHQRRKDAPSGALEAAPPSRPPSGPRAASLSPMVGNDGSVGESNNA